MNDTERARDLRGLISSNCVRTLQCVCEEMLNASVIVETDERDLLEYLANIFSDDATAQDVHELYKPRVRNSGRIKRFPPRLIEIQLAAFLGF